ncbi:1-phosphofructokinase family hexose kinase [Pseudonocardia sp. CA-107938]|uniref:1-phosphofructokinase family hexose kinase n=1 Tax=Pseudonocardia sp. CA-107938 TaxID=3240021 RepID=UPI003D8CEACD
MSLLCVALSPSVDVTYQVPRLGGISRPHTVVRVPGGKGFNVARAAHTLGASVGAAGIVGGHSGRWIADGLAAAGIAAELVEGAEETRSCVTITADDGASTEVYEPPTPVTADEWAALTAVVAGAAADWVALSGALPPGAPDGAIGVLADAAGGRVAVDTHGAALVGAVAHADLVKINAAEAAALLGTDGPPDELATRLLETTDGPQLVVVTAGAAGAVAVTRDDRGPVWARPPALPAHHPVGSGDSFLAGLLTADPSDLDDALRRAVAAGAANALVPGAAVLDPERCAELTPQVRLDR